MSSIQSWNTLSNAGALKLFESLAEAAWDWLDYARRLSLGFSEDTITDLTALQIARSRSNGISVQTVSKRKERRVGFDWLWVIRRPALPPHAYVVQAKKLRLRQSMFYSYGTLKYPPRPPYQIDALDRFAKKIGATPLYCFYNNLDSGTAASHWHCRQQPQPDVPQMGCTLVALDAVRKIHNSPGPRTFSSVHSDPDAVPWRCLFHPACTTFGIHNVSTQNSEAINRGSSSADSLSELTSVDDDTIDIDDIIRQLDLEDFVDREATDSIVPIPERILSVRLED